MTDTPNADLDLALRLADAADAISRDRFRAGDLDVSLKADHTHVTDADRAVETAIREMLGRERPADGIFGEEFGDDEATGRQWLIDPIDGTANFLRGVPVWGTLIALTTGRSPVIGVVSSPALGRRWWAAAGEGAWTSAQGAEPHRIHVSAVDTLQDASLSFQSIRQWDEAGYLEKLIDLSRSIWRDRAYGDMWSYMLLAEGLIDVTGEFGVHPYDVAAVIPIVQEAGGRFSSVTGEPGPWHGSALATNGALHEKVLAALR